VLAFEHDPLVVVFADSADDERRARAWLAGSGQVRALLEALIAGDDTPRRIHPATTDTTQ
jgi:hypothetical protein